MQQIALDAVMHGNAQEAALPLGWKISPLTTVDLLSYYNIVGR